MLDSRNIDLGLVAEPKNRKSLSFSPVMKISDVFVCTPAYMENLFLREGKTPNIFQTGNIILLDRSNISRKHVDSYLTDNQIEVNQLLEVTDMTLGIEFAKIGLGISCVVKEFVAEELKNGTLIEVPLELPIPKRVIGFAYHDSDESETLKEFLEFCK